MNPMEASSLSHPFRLLPDREAPHLVGMVHLLPLPGSSGWRGDMGSVIRRAVHEAGLLAGAGFDAVVVENYGDIPFHPGPVPPETIAAMAVVTAAVVSAVEIPVGVNVLRNDAAGGLAVAGAAGASFIRVNVHTGGMWTDQGLLQGDAHRTLRLRAGLRVTVSILADVLVKHAVPPAGVTAENAARDAWFRGLADGLIVTGPATGAGADPDQVRRVAEAVPDAPLYVGSGLTPENARASLAGVTGAIVGSTLHHDGVAGRGLDPERVRAFMQAVRRGGGAR
jgi:uncharacterized protein